MAALWTPEELQELSDAYVLGKDVSADQSLMDMAREQAARVQREFEKVRKQVRVIFTERDPYRNLEEMISDIEGNRRMFVFTGFSDTPLWEPEINWRARAVHDWDHYKAQVDFSLPGEVAAYRYTAAKAPELAPLYLSEIALQAASATVLGDFPSGRQKVVRASEKIQRLAMKRNPALPEKARDRAELAATLLRFMSPEQAMAHLAAAGVPEGEATLSTLAGELIQAELGNPLVP